MKKNIVQDVVPPKKSIRNIKISSKKETVKESKVNSYVEETPTPPRDPFVRSVPLQAPMRIEPSLPPTPPKFTEPSPSSYKYEYNDTKKKSRKWLYFFIFVLILVGAFGLSTFFKSAEIKISPKQENKPLSGNFVARRDAVTGLGFQTVTVTKDIEKTVPATGEEKVDRKSTGKIVIYNNYNSQPQKLVATTRFQTPEGLIFRLVEPASVPGKTVKDGKSVAGEVEVTVEADKPGVSYNIGLKDFTIPGLKGDPKYTAIYARSKTDMTGGFSGMQKIVSKEALASAEGEMKASLENVLLNDVSAQIPANFISYKEGISYELDPIVQVPGSTTADVVLRKKGKATAIIFDRVMLTKSILDETLQGVESETVKIANLSNLSFKLASSSRETDKQVSFSLSGDVNFVWTFDENKLKNDLLGLSKKSALVIISKYPSINEAWVETKPFWNQTIPNDLQKVTLINTAGAN